MWSVHYDIVFNLILLVRMFRSECFSENLNNDDNNNYDNNNIKYELVKK